MLRQQRVTASLDARDPAAGAQGCACKQLLDSIEAEGDIKTGVNILRRALEEPLRGIAANAGQDGAVVIAEVRRRQAEGSITTCPLVTSLSAIALNQ